MSSILKPFLPFLLALFPKVEQSTYNIPMQNRFEYNFTRESEFEELKDRNNDLEQQNTLLKQSLQELIKVNNELTESIEELNNNNNYNQNHEDIEERFEMLIEENRNLRQQLENELDRNRTTKKSMMEDDNQTENLVNVLEELIESFKNIEVKYESQIVDLENSIENNRKEYSDRLLKVQQELSNKISTIEALSIQLKRKDELLESISAKFNKLEQQGGVQLTKSNRAQESDLKKLQVKIDSINRTLQQKQKVIKLYETLINSLKGKILQKY